MNDAAPPDTVRPAPVDPPRVPLREKRLFIAIFLLGLALRLYNLGGPSLWYDEAASLYLGQQITSVGSLFDPALTSEPPVNALLTRAWQVAVDTLFSIPAIDSRHDFLLRLLPCLFSIASLPLIFVLARRLFRDNDTALGAMFLCAISPFQIYYAQELRVYSLYVFLALISVWCMVRALEEDRPRLWVALVLSMALMMYCHFIAMWHIFTLNVVFVALLWRYKHLFWKWTAANALVLLLIAPMLYRAFAMHAEVQGIEIKWYPNPDWKTVLITFKNLFAGYGPSSWFYRVLFLLVLLFWCLPFRRIRTEAQPLILLGCLTWVPIIGCAWVWGRSEFSFYEHRLFIFSGVAAALLVARGILLLPRWHFVVLIALSLFTLPGLADTYAGRLHPILVHRIAMWDKVDFRAAAAYLEEHAQPGDRLLYTSHFSAYPMYHYFPHDQVRIGWEAADEDVFISLMGHEAILRSHQLMPVPKEQAVAGAQRLWLLSTQGVTFEWHEATDRIAGWLNEHYEQRQDTSFDGVRLRLFAPPGPSKANGSDEHE